MGHVYHLGDEAGAGRRLGGRRQGKREGPRAGSWWVSPALSILDDEEGRQSHCDAVGWKRREVA